MGKLDKLLQKSEEKERKKSAENGAKLREKQWKRWLDIFMCMFEGYLGRFIEWPKSSMVWDSKEKNNMLFS